jgi:hypothetical protein
LLQADPVRGTAHLRTPLARGVAIIERLQGRLSGIALPKLICDTPGGLGKVPLGPEVIVARRPGRTTLRTFRGEEVDYVDPVPEAPAAVASPSSAPSSGAPSAKPRTMPGVRPDLAGGGPPAWPLPARRLPLDDDC